MSRTGLGEPAVSYPPEYPQEYPPVAAAPPEAPRGPGVTPPFPAPPTEGRTARLAWGIGAGVLIILLLCGGGTAAVVALGTVATRALDEQAHVVVGDYLDAVRDKRYDDAYEQLCAKEQRAETAAEFARRVAAEEPIRSYDVGRVNIATAEPVVPVAVVYEDGGNGQFQVFLDQNQQTGEFMVCGIEE